MLAKIWNILSNAGVDSNLNRSASRYIILTNRFAFIAGLIALIVLVMYFIVGSLGWTIPRFILLISSLVYFSVLLLNVARKYNLAKWIICWLPAILILSISLSDKFLYPENTTIKDFFSYRFFLMATSIIPLMIFGTKKPKTLFFNLLPSFLGTVLFEYIHQLFGMGFHHFGYDDTSFYLLDIMIALAYFGLVGFLLNQIIISERFEAKMDEQQNILEEKNKELLHMNTFINEQNYEMNAQSDNLKESHHALIKASKIIEKQKQLLENQNKNLEKQVEEKTRDLSRVNEELVINNNEMRQFSHTLSHNLKSPVATFQGLLNLIEQKDLNVANKELLKYLNESVSKMQEVFSDMNEMLELRNTLYLSTEAVDLQKEIDEIHNRFYAEIRDNKISFNYDFNGHKVIKTNGKRLNGILYQLISNSIKFRSESRKPEISIMLHKKEECYCLKVRDNGIGIDLAKYGNKLFYPYQRFNMHIYGKGLGLYLVKLQAESLGGNVNIHSEPDRYTEVEVQLRA